ncbi:hypothetical protein QQ045_027792 [Rhodiola kirilowii]
MVKNKLKEEYDLPTNLEALNKWTIPRIEPSLIYKLGMFEKIDLKQVVKTTEETIPLNSDELTIRLLEEKVVPPQPISHNNLFNLIQTPEGTITLEFDNISRPSMSSRPSSRLSKSSSMRNYISPFDYKIEQPIESSRASTSQIRDTERIQRLIMDQNNIVNGLNTKDSEITKSEMDFNL